MKRDGLSGKMKTMAGTPSIKETITVKNNAVARDVCGMDHENIRFIEDTLNVRIKAQGEDFDIIGNQSAVTEAIMLIKEIETHTTTHRKDMTVADIKGIMNTKSHQAPEGSTNNSGRAQLKTRKTTLLARTPTQETYMRALTSKAGLIFGTGPAGTGKTYLAVAHAVGRLERGEIERIILSRPAVEAGERLGFLPGDMKEKVDPYLRPLYDAMYDTMEAKRIDDYINDGTIEVAPLAFMRGRTLPNAVIILDEGQNTTSMQMKMFLTRMGEGSQMIVTGDPSQIDLPYGTVSGLIEALAITRGLEGVEICEFTGKDVVRHELVGRIVNAYEKADAKAKREHAPRITGSKAPALTPQR